MEAYKRVAWDAIKDVIPYLEIDIKAFASGVQVLEHARVELGNVPLMYCTSPTGFLRIARAN